MFLATNTSLAVADAVDLGTISASLKESSQSLLQCTDNKPSRKMHVMLIFRDTDIWSFHTSGTGIARTIRSVATSDTAKPSSMSWVLSQYKAMVFGLVHHAAASVLHWKAVAKKKASDHSPIKTHIPSENRSKALPTNIRR